MRKAVMILSVLAVIALTVLNLTWRFGPEPDIVCPMANRNIVWYYAGK